MTRRQRLGPYLVKVNIRIEQAQRAIDVIHVYHRLAKLVLQGIYQARQFGALGSKGGYNMRVSHARRLEHLALTRETKPFCRCYLMPEFQRPVLDSLRQPLETGEVSVARANAHVTFPARVQLIAAMNPCRCGHLGDPALACSRAPRCAADYQSKVSGPLLDRIDLHVEVDPVSAADLSLPPPAEGSAQVAARVARARSLQSARFVESHARTNAELDGDALEKFATPDEPGRALLMQAAEAMRLSARGYTRMLRVARTIADLAGAQGVGRAHVAEALSYRRQVPRA